MSNKLTKTQRETLIWKLMNAFPGSLSSITAGVIDAYVEATLDFSPEAIVRSIEQYRKGLVDDHRGAFAPAAPDFARNVRAWEKALAFINGDAPKEKLVAYPMGQKPPPPLVPLGPVEIDHGAGKVDLRGLSHAEKEAAIDGRKPDPVVRLATEGGKVLPMPKLRKVDDNG